LKRIRHMLYNSIFPVQSLGAAMFMTETPVSPGSQTTHELMVTTTIDRKFGDPAIFLNITDFKKSALFKLGGIEDNIINTRRIVERVLINVGVEKGDVTYSWRQVGEAILSFMLMLHEQAVSRGQEGPVFQGHKLRRRLPSSKKKTRLWSRLKNIVARRHKNPKEAAAKSASTVSNNSTFIPIVDIFDLIGAGSKNTTNVTDDHEDDVNNN
jgi:hypothetical protein